MTGDLAEYIPTEEVSTVVSNPAENLTYQDFIDIIDFIAPFLEKEQQEKVLEFKELLVSFSPDEIEAVIEFSQDVIFSRSTRAGADNEIVAVAAGDTEATKINHVELSWRVKGLRHV